LTMLKEQQPAQEVIPSDKQRIKKRLKILESLKGCIPSDVDLEAARAERVAKRAVLPEPLDKNIDERLKEFDAIMQAIETARDEEMPPIEPIRFREVES